MDRQMLLKECIEYFKGNKGFERVFDKMKEKYKSLGGMGGTLVLQNLTQKEKEALTGFMKKDFLHRKSASIKIGEFQKALSKTRFAELDLEEIMHAYFGHQILSNSEARDIYKEERDSFFCGIICKYRSTHAGRWLEYIFNSSENAYKTLMQRYESDRQKLSSDVELVCNALNNLPCLNAQKLRLPMFASLIARNPHVFDEGTPCGQLLIYGLMYRFNTQKPRNSQEKTELFYKAGILYDEVSNYVLCSGLKAYSNGRLHQGWEGFCNAGEPMLVSLSNLSKIDRVCSLSGKVFVFENPGVFSTLLDIFCGKYDKYLYKSQELRVPLICTYGQLKLACFVLLDMLAAEGTLIYYSGDFDPEGLLIADRLKERYGKNLILWRYTAEDYDKSLSGESLSAIRIKKMENLKDRQLVNLAQAIIKKGYAGYQELIVDELASDICRFGQYLK